MVKFDVGQLKYMSKDDFRVLTAVEMGMKNHELVPKQMIANIAGIRGAGAFVALQELHKHKMVWHSSAPYEGFKLTYQGYDALAIHAFERGGLLKGVGRRVGCGKESDIYVVTTPENRELAMKMHRLGRTSFRAVKSKRDYLKKKKAKSWLYLSRLAAMKEYAFMKVLYAHGFPVPEPVGVNRHAVLMEMCPGTLLAHVAELEHPEEAYETIMQLIVRLAQHGLIHCDCNEFNLIVDEHDDGTVDVRLIDFPQMVSTSHANAEFYFNRDVQCVVTFFRRRFGYESSIPPPTLAVRDSGEPTVSLDVEVEASGYSPARSDKDLEAETSALDVTQSLEDREAANHQADDGDDGDSDDSDEDGDEPAAAAATAEAAAETTTEKEADEEGEEKEEEEEEEGEEEEDGAVGVEVDHEQVMRNAKRKIGVKHRAPVRKLGHSQKTANKRAMHYTITDSY